VIAAGLLVLSVAVGNIMCNPLMPAADVAHDVGRLFVPAMTPPMVVCANEIEPARYKATFRRTASAAGYRTVGLYSANPVAVRRTGPWKVAGARVRFLSRGVEHITPDRTATVVRLVTDAGDQLVIVCAHLVSRAWTHLEPSTPLRRHLWRTAARAIRAICRPWHARGVPVVVAGDLNHPRPVRWAPVQRILANQGLLQITLIPAAGQRVQRTRAGRTIPSTRLYTDHPILSRTAALRAGS
jgi:hypothetical protein